MIAILSILSQPIATVDTGNEIGTIALTIAGPECEVAPRVEMLACHARALSAALLHYAATVEAERRAKA